MDAHSVIIDDDKSDVLAMESDGSSTLDLYPEWSDNEEPLTQQDMEDANPYVGMYNPLYDFHKCPPNPYSVGLVEVAARPDPLYEFIAEQSTDKSLHSYTGGDDRVLRPDEPDYYLDHEPQIQYKWNVPELYYEGDRIKVGHGAIPFNTNVFDWRVLMAQLRMLATQLCADHGYTNQFENGPTNRGVRYTFEIENRVRILILKDSVSYYVCEDIIEEDYDMEKKHPVEENEYILADILTLCFQRRVSSDMGQYMSPKFFV